MPQLNPEFFISQLFWLILTFSFLLFFLWKISLPRISSVLEKRDNKINNDVNTAKKMQAEAEEIQKQIEDQLKKAKDETSDQIKGAIQNIQAKSLEELSNLDKILNKKIEDSGLAIEKNKNNSLEQINSQIFEVTKLTLNKISTLNIDDKEIKNSIEKMKSKVAN
ncbi:MAG: ATP synthase subunit b [Alphaproteobacteria bacterium MarineAlpha5_Bin8]|nr:MAG: ATP synthase subunit b [Alphaproteobacteria bacterium MarineAlpha5_Bin7]PPR48127.1 MAG: ATP synthase subunit b [Alphaproteobacteria bacterium MarineAlpha5_Bin8]PPR53220.1 MAG: ATP synthase subunit b [Alphaproteobacteria bacterium MarineAlpha5_Bin6]|tara:strand:+ start:725 stop:1219 length:495 start_codon:yes stop_codon:yes gene_type:complete